MAEKELPTADDLRKLLRYEPETGRLFWRERPYGHQWADKQVYLFNRRFAGKEAGWPRGTGYLSVRIKWKGQKLVFQAHRVAWCMEFGRWPNEVDHINGDRADNRLANLRDGDRSFNQRNRRMHKNNSTGIAGVHVSGAGWQATFARRDGSMFSRYYTDLEKARREIPAIRRAEGYSDR